MDQSRSEPCVQLPDEVKINISEKLMIQASAKYVNLGIHL